MHTAQCHGHRVTWDCTRTGLVHLTRDHFDETPVLWSGKDGFGPIFCKTPAEFEKTLKWLESNFEPQNKYGTPI